MARSYNDRHWCMPAAQTSSIRTSTGDETDGEGDVGSLTESNSPWASPVVWVKKKLGGLWFCVDYRALNALTRKNMFPKPRIDDMRASEKGTTSLQRTQCVRYSKVPVYNSDTS